MREILFRGKRTDNGEWVYGTGVVSDYSNTFIVKFDYYFDHFDVYPETVGQYTGLTDKNGQKIFEGDIVKFNERSMFYHEDDVELVEYEWGGFYPLCEHNSCECVVPHEDCEVIGNITDNPELLGDK